MKLLNTASYEIKKSKFIAYFYQIDTKENVLEILENLRKEHKKARHIPHAYILSNTAGKSDDKEPSGTAGMPLYRILERNGFSSHALFVVRYFGGIKLGAGGLLRSYSAPANQSVTDYKKSS